jgi:cytochrome c556
MLLLGAMACAGCTQATQAPLAPAPAFAAENVIAARQAAFSLSASVFNSLKGAIDRGQAPKTQVFPAKALAKWSTTLPLLFPSGSTAANSRAKAGIWADRADFDAKAAAFAQSTAALVAATESDDKAAFATQWSATQKHCAACHAVYRAEAPRS